MMKEHPKHTNGQDCHCIPSCPQCPLPNGQHCSSCHNEHEEHAVPLATFVHVLERFAEAKASPAPGRDGKDGKPARDSYRNWARDFFLGLIAVGIFTLVGTLWVFMPRVVQALERHEDAAVQRIVDERVSIFYQAHRDELRGADGINGTNGINGVNGQKGDPGIDGTKGADGTSAAPMPPTQEQIEEAIAYLVTIGALNFQGPAGRDGAKGDKGDKGDPALSRMSMGDLFAQIRAQCRFVGIANIGHSGGLLVLCGQDGIVLPNYGQPMTIGEAISSRFITSDNTPAEALARIRQIYLQSHP